MRFGKINLLSNLQNYWVVFLLICNLFVTAACQIEKKSIELILQSCNELLDKNDVLGAGKCFEKAINSNPNQAEELTKNFEEKFFGKCLEFKEKEDYKNSIVCFEGMSVFTPNSGNVRFLLAESYYEYDRIEKYSKTGDFELLDKASDSIEKGLKIKPEDAAGYGLYGQILEGKLDWQGALSKYREAVRLDKTFANYWIKLALMQEKLNDENAAAESYRKALELEPENTLSLYYLGKIYAKKGKTDKAIETLEKLLKINPNFEDAEQILQKLKENRR